MKSFLLLFIVLLPAMLFSQSGIQGEFIFQPDEKLHGHTHASSIVECPDGSLLACWYEGVSDKSRDVHIQAARLLKGKTDWSEPFLLADTPMLSDNNPCLYIDEQERLWLFYYTLLGAPEEPWDTAFLRYKISSDYLSTPVTWYVQKDLPVIPNGLDETIELLCDQNKSNLQVQKMCEQAQPKLKSQLARRLGWTTRTSPVRLSNGKLLLPMASEIFGLAAMALTPDNGNTWEFSKPALGYGIEQPTALERKDGTLVAWFRDSSGIDRIRKSESTDMGMTWGPVTETDFPNPGAGIQVLRLKSGNVMLIYNDNTDEERNSLVVSLSDDEGSTWKWKKQIEKSDKGRYDYPALIQTRDEMLHATYSHDVKTIKHVTFTEGWVKNE